MSPQDYFEALMLLCFSISWYWSIAQMVRVKTAIGKSPGFVALICSGYVLGIASKTIAWRAGGELNPVVWLYVWNLLVTFADLLLVIYYSRPRYASVR